MAGAASWEVPSSRTTRWSGTNAVPHAGETFERATQRLSRCFTLHHALERLLGGRPVPTELHCHVLGPDRREGESVASTRRIFAPFLSLLTGSGCRQVHLLLCGPNCCAEGESQSATVSVANAAEGAEGVGSTELMEKRPPMLHVLRSSLLYHELIARADWAPPHVAVAFNAGVWGYDTWAETILAVLRQRVPFVVTSYNLTEAETDEEHLVDVARHRCPDENKRSDLRCHFLWEPEPNPWASLVAEERGGAAAYFENAFTQCVVGPTRTQSTRQNES